MTKSKSGLQTQEIVAAKAVVVVNQQVVCSIHIASSILEILSNKHLLERISFITRNNSIQYIDSSKMSSNNT